MSMLEEKYPSESWVRVYTDGSATNERRGQYEEQQSEAIPTGLHCSNYKAEGEAIIHTAHFNLFKKIGQSDTRIACGGHVC